MTWRLEFERAAQRALARMHPQWRERILDALDRLAADPPTATGVKKLTGDGGFRLRVGGYRVLYRLDGGRLVVVVIDVGPRGGIYG